MRTISVGVLAWVIYGIGSSLVDHYIASALAKPSSWGKAFVYECSWTFTLAALNKPITAVTAQLTCFDVVTQPQVEDIDLDPLPERRIENREDCLYSPVEVALH